MPDLDATWIGTVTLEWLQEDDIRFLVHKGGTRSGKTYNACIAWIDYLMNEGAGEKLSIVRATGPALKASVIEDLKEVLQLMGYYSEKRHNKTEMEIELPSGARINYFPTDDGQKVRGQGRDHLWMNEANEIPYSAYDQMEWRTRGKIMLDFNPSFQPNHWIIQELQGSERALWYTSTYRDNPHLTSEQERSIEALREKDDWKWKVFGLGKVERPAAAIYTDIGYLHEWNHDDWILGLDFGYNHPMSLNRVKVVDREGKPELHVWALLHESYLTTKDLIDRLPLLLVWDIQPISRADEVDVTQPTHDIARKLNQLRVTKQRRMVCDSEAPDKIETLQRAGYNAIPAKKGAGSVKAGIDLMKDYRIRIGGPAAERAMMEFESYRWKRDRQSDELLDEPEDGDDHAPDAVRYPAFKFFRKHSMGYFYAPAD